MNWDTIIWISLSIFGAALIVGGIVAYRGSRRTGVRAFVAASIAAGVVMWAIVIVTIPVSGTEHGSPEPTLHFQEHTSNEYEGPEGPLSVAELEETAIYAAVIQQLAIVDDTFGGNLNPKTLYVIKNTDDSAGNPVEGQQSDTRLITETMQSEVSSMLDDLSVEIIWIERFEDAEFEKPGFEVKRGGAIITLGNIYLREGGSVQVAGSIYVANLAAGGTTYILEEVDGTWEITDRAGPTWIS